METKFQTSFIPKKPLMPAGSPGGLSQPPRKRGSSLFMTISVLVFLASLLAAGGSYFYKSLLLSSQEGYKQQLVEREKQFNADLIEKLKRQDVQLTLAGQILQNHLAVSQVFGIIGLLTIENVRFTSMDLSTGPGVNDGVKVTMKGYGTSLSAVAFQSDVLGKLDQYNLRKVVKNPILSDPALDTGGAVSFGFSATIDPESLSYEKSLNQQP